MASILSRPQWVNAEMFLGVPNWQILFSNLFDYLYQVNTLRPRQNPRHFADDIFKSIFLNENARIALKISLKFVPDGPINNIPALVQIMAWRRLGDKPLSEPMMVSSLTHICLARPQWLKSSWWLAWLMGRTPFINSLAPGGFEWNLRVGIFMQIYWLISCEIALRWMSLGLILVINFWWNFPQMTVTGPY